MNLNTLGRSERLKSEKSICRLFETGSHLSAYPIRLIYQSTRSTDNFPFKIGFTVPKKNFNRAVDRNLLKRRMREAYRLNKQILNIKEPKFQFGLEIMLVYQSQKAEDFIKISDCIKILLKKLLSKILKEC